MASEPFGVAQFIRVYRWLKLAYKKKSTFL